MPDATVQAGFARFKSTNRPHECDCTERWQSDFSSKAKKRAALCVSRSEKAFPNANNLNQQRLPIDLIFKKFLPSDATLDRNEYALQSQVAVRASAAILPAG